MNKGGLYHAARGLLLAVLLVACSDPQPWKLHDITGLMPDLAFQLSDVEGNSITATQYRGKVTLLYFGYTHCPDVCPTTLANLAAVLRKLGKAAEHIQVLFVSVDPDRDSPAVLRSYLSAFGPWFIGLTGSDEQLRSLSKAYRVTYSRDKPDQEGEYAVTHSSAVFIFDARSRVRLLATDRFQQADLAADLKRLVAES